MLTVQVEYILAYIFSECNSFIEEKPLVDSAREILEKAIEKGYCVDVSLHPDINGIPEGIGTIRKWINDGLLEYNIKGKIHSFKPIYPSYFKIILNDYKSYYPKLNDFESDIKEILKRKGF